MFDKASLFRFCALFLWMTLCLILLVVVFGMEYFYFTYNELSQAKTLYNCLNVGLAAIISLWLFYPSRLAVAIAGSFTLFWPIVLGGKALELNGEDRFVRSWQFAIISLFCLCALVVVTNARRNFLNIKSINKSKL